MAEPIAVRETSGAAAVAPELTLAGAATLVRRRSIWRRAGPAFWAGAVLLALVVFVAAAAPILTPYDPIKQDFAAIFKAPGVEHPFGTDNFGRDIMSRTFFSTRIDLQIGIFSVIFPF